MSPEKNIEEQHWFTNKQVIALLFFAVTLTFEAAYFQFTLTALGKKHDAEIKQVRLEMKVIDNRLNKKIPVIYENKRDIMNTNFKVRILEETQK